MAQVNSEKCEAKHVWKLNRELLLIVDEQSPEERIDVMGVSHNECYRENRIVYMPHLAQDVAMVLPFSRLSLAQQEDRLSCQS